MSDGGSAEDTTGGLVLGVDHVTTVLGDRPARQLLAGLTRLGLPVAWPLADYGRLWTGGVRLGNLDLEIIGLGEEPPPRTPGATGAQPPAGAAARSPVGWPAAVSGGGTAAAAEGGIGWPESSQQAAAEATAGGQGGGPGQWPPQLLTLAAASLADLPGQLDQRGVRHGEPEPFPPRPPVEPLRTVMDLPDFGGDTLAVGISASPHGPRTETVPSQDLAGVQRVERVVVGARDMAAARERWAPLLAPETPGQEGSAQQAVAAVWQPGSGPALEVRPASQDAVIELVLLVGSLALARAAFTAAGLEVAGDLVTIGTFPARLAA